MSIAVIIPYYNNSEDVERCLQSVLNQTMKADEVFLVDDCSEDSAALELILSRYINKLKINYYRNQENKNGAYSRNYGMLRATSKYIALLDADDFWDESHLEVSLSMLTTAKADFCYSNISVKKEGGVKRIKVDDVNQLINPNDIILLSPPQTGSFFFKKEITNTTLFDDKLRRHQDYQFLLDVILNGTKIVYNDVYTSYYCVSRSQGIRKLDFSSIFSFWDMYKKNFSIRPLQEFLIRMLCLSMRTEKNHNMSYYINKYPVLRVVTQTSFYKVYKIIGDGNVPSKTFLFIYFKIRYDLRKKIKF